MNIQQRNLELGKRLARVRDIYRRPPQRAILYPEKPTVYQTTPVSALTRAYDAEKPIKDQTRSSVYRPSRNLLDVLDMAMHAHQSRQPTTSTGASIETDRLGIPYSATGYIEGRSI